MTSSYVKFPEVKKKSSEPVQTDSDADKSYKTNSLESRLGAYLDERRQGNYNEIEGLYCLIRVVIVSRELSVHYIG